MEKEKIERINALARASKERELTADERAEQKALREEYLLEFRRGLSAQLDATTIRYPDGTEKRLGDRDRKK